MLYDGSATRWRKVPGGFEALRFEARVEDAACAAFGAVQPMAGGAAESDSLLVYAPGAPDVEPGDYLVGRACGDGEPPADARRVVRRRAYTLRGEPHHLEVVAR